MLQIYLPSSTDLKLCSWFTYRRLPRYMNFFWGAFFFREHFDVQHFDGEHFVLGSILWRAFGGELRWQNLSSEVLLMSFWWLEISNPILRGLDLRRRLIKTGVYTCMCTLLMNKMKHTTMHCTHFLIISCGQCKLHLVWEIWKFIKKILVCPF